MASYRLGLNVGSKEIVMVGAVIAGLAILGFVLNSQTPATAETRMLGDGNYKSVLISA